MFFKKVNLDLVAVFAFVDLVQPAGVYIVPGAKSEAGNLSTSDLLN